MSQITENLTIKQRAIQVVNLLTQKKIPLPVQMFLNPYLNQFQQLSDEEFESMILPIIDEVEYYFNYIKTGKTDAD